MIFSGEKLVCTSGNPFFKEGVIYTVGNIVTSELFEVQVGANNEYWYATKEGKEVCVRFDSKEYEISNAWFSRMKKSAH